MVVRHWNRGPERCAVFILGDTQNLAGQGPEQLCLSRAFSEWGVGPDDVQRSLRIKLFYDFCDSLLFIILDSYISL